MVCLPNNGYGIIIMMVVLLHGWILDLAPGLGVAFNSTYRLIFTLFLHPAPPSQ